MNERFEGDIADVPVRKTITPFVIPDKHVVFGKVLQEMTPHRALPVILEVVQPVGCLDQRPALSSCGVRDLNSIGRRAEANLLVRSGRATGGRRVCLTVGIQLDPVDTDGPRDVLELLLTQVLIVEGKLAFDLAKRFARDTDPAALSECFQASSEVDPVTVEPLALFSLIAKTGYRILHLNSRFS